MAGFMHRGYEIRHEDCSQWATIELDEDVRCGYYTEANGLAAEDLAEIDTIIDKHEATIRARERADVVAMLDKFLEDPRINPDEFRIQVETTRAIRAMIERGDHEGAADKE